MTEDRVFIEGFRVALMVGTTPEERAFPQPVEIDIDIETPLGAAGRSDNLADTVDYAFVIAQLREDLPTRSYALVEAVAERVANIALSVPIATEVRVLVRKYVIAEVRSVGVEIVRRQAESE